MAAPIPGTPVSTPFNSSTSPKTTASMSVVAGETLVAVAIIADSNGADDNLSVSGGSLTWELAARDNIASNTQVAIWTATVDTDKSMTVAFASAGNPSAWYGGTVIPFTGATGVGTAVASNASGLPSIEVDTPQGNCAIVFGIGDWSAQDGASRVYLTNAGAATEDLYFRDAAQYTAYVAHHADAGAAGAKNIGLSAPGGQTWAMVGVPILGSAAATFNDAPSGTAVASGTNVESWAGVYNDAPSGTAVASGTNIEGSGILVSVPSSSTTPTSRSMPSSVIAVVYSDSPVGLAAATGTLTESYLPPTGFNDAPSGAAVASGSITESWSHADVFPGVTTSIDTFDRADGAVYAGAGGAIWGTTPIVTGSPVADITTNTLVPTAGGAECVTLAQFGPDVDFYWTIAGANTIDASHYLACFFAFQASDAAWPDTGHSGYALIGGLTATANEWSLFRYTGGAGTNIGSFGVQAVSLGDSIGVSMRGSTISAHYKPAAGEWTTIGSIDDSTYNREGYLGFEFGSVGIDNLTGGTYTAPSGPPTYNDTVSGTGTATGTTSDALGFTEARSGSGSAAGSVTDGLARDDTPTGSSTASGSITESWGIGQSDSPTGTAVATGSLSESWRVNVTVTGSAPASGSCNDTLAHDSARTGGATASGSSVDRLDVDDAPSGALVAFGSLIETWGNGRFDSPTGTASPAGTTVESHLHAPRLSGTQAADGTTGESAERSTALNATATATGSLVEFVTNSTIETSPAGHVLHRTAPTVINGAIRRRNP